MPTSLTNLLQSVEVSEPQAVGSLQVFALHWPVANGLSYVTLDEALAAQTLEVTEVTEGGSVPTLKVRNKAKDKVFLMAGEQLIGAKQNRVLNASILVAGHSELPIPVSCVEAGRWHYRSPQFGSGGTMSHGKLRKMMSGHSHQGYRSRQSPVSDQREVWGEVSRKLDKMGSPSPSHDLYQVYEDHQARLNDLLGQLRLPSDAWGVAFGVKGKIAGADLFDRPVTLAKLWPKLVRAFALDALEEAEDAGTTPLTPADVGRWLRSASDARAEPFPSPGLGTDIRLEGPALAGAGLVVEDHPVHVELFTRELGPEEQD